MKTAVKKYWPQYKWSNVFQMIRNMKEKPVVCNEDFKNKLAVITGATSGIGYYTTLKYASMGAKLITINRNEEKSKALVESVKKLYGTEIEYFLADLSRLDDIYRSGYFLANIEEPVDVLIHNAGIYLSKRTVTADGLETNFVLHYLAPFIINNLLLEKYNKDTYGRILFVSSEGYRFSVWGPDLDDLQSEKKRYTGLKAYGTAKILQLLTMHIFAERLKPYNVTINAMHPGMVKTNTGRDNGKLYKWFKRNFIDKNSQSPEISAEALYYLGVSKEIDNITDHFFHLTTMESLNQREKRKRPYNEE